MACNCGNLGIYADSEFFFALTSFSQTTLLFTGNAESHNIDHPCGFWSLLNERSIMLQR